MKTLSTSLVKFHASLGPIKKDAENPFFKSDYLTLSGILDAVRRPLAANGLAVVQSMRVQDACTVLVTRLLHECGEELTSEMVMPVLIDPQKLGSLITYYKRYQLQALLGISTADEDDDGNAVSLQQQQPVKQAPAKQPVKPTFQLDGVSQQKVLSGAASDAQKGALKKMGIKFADNITKQEASELIAEANRIK
jgi:hypothetical protein